MRLAGIELRNFRCFEHLALDLDETTVIVGANDTGKSTVLEAIHWLLDAGEIDWDDAVRDSGEAAQIIGLFADLPEPDANSLADFMTDGVLKVGISSASGIDRWLIVSPEQADTIRGRIDLDMAAESVRAGTVPAGFEAGVADSGEGGPEVWYWWWIWEFGNQTGWHLLDDWDRTAAGLGPIRAIRLGTSGETAWDPIAVLSPMLQRHLAGEFDRELAEALEVVEDRYFELLGRVSRAHSAALNETSAYKWIRWHGVAVASEIEENLVGSLTTNPAGPPEFRSTEPGASLRDQRVSAMLAIARARTTTLSDLGPGTQRSVAMAALELYRDPDLWPLGGSVVLLVEEPEAGLHPAAQRDAAALLAGLATHGLQVIALTHSAAFINAARPNGVRLARKTTDADGEIKRDVLRPIGLAEVRDELGVRPADILLARRFVIVEGPSDRLILDAWARSMGVDLGAAQVQLVPTGGYTSAHRVAQFLSLAYEGAEFVVVLDEGAHALKSRLEIQGMKNDRVRVVVLSKTAIEGFFGAAAVTAWLGLRGATDVSVEDDVAAALDEQKGGRVAALDRLSHRFLGRAYDKVTDGLTIASLTTERDVAPEIVGLITDLTRD